MKTNGMEKVKGMEIKKREKEREKSAQRYRIAFNERKILKKKNIE